MSNMSRSLQIEQGEREMEVERAGMRAFQAQRAADVKAWRYKRANPQHMFSKEEHRLGGLSRVNQGALNQEPTGRAFCLYPKALGSPRRS